LISSNMVDSRCMYDYDTDLLCHRYNPATQARGFTAAQADQARSKKSRSDWALQDVQQKVQARF
jgi:hypothetical protein